MLLALRSLVEASSAVADVDDAALLLPPRGTGVFEQIQARVIAWRLPNAFALAERLRTLWNPMTCPESELPILAWALSVDFWNDNWSVPRKRQVVAEARLYHRRKTTVAGARMALSYRDASLVRAYTPRQGLFCDKAVDGAEQAAWAATLPEIRVYDASPAILSRRAWGFAGVNCYARADARYARPAALVRDGSSTALTVIPMGDPSQRGERIILPVPREDVLVVGRAGARYVAPGDLGLTTLAVHWGDGDNYTREAATPGDAGAFISARRKQVAGAKAVFAPAGARRPVVAAPVAIARGYLALAFSDQAGRLTAHAPANVVGRSRVMRAPYTANYLVAWSRRIPAFNLPVSRRVSAPSEPTVLGLMRAIADSQALRDRNSLSLSATRRLSYGDLRALSASARYGERRENI